MASQMSFPVIEVKTLPACRCRRDWVRFVGPRPGRPATTFQACVECAARDMDLTRASIFSIPGDPPPFQAFVGMAVAG